MREKRDSDIARANVEMEKLKLEYEEKRAFEITRANIETEKMKAEYQAKCEYELALAKRMEMEIAFKARVY